MAERFLNLYVAYQFTPDYWALPAPDRREIRVQIADESKAASEACHLYSIFPGRPDSDFMIWSAWGADDPAVVQTAFTKYSLATENWRRYVKPAQTLWGFTRPSMYSRGKSEQDMDPMEGERTSYLVVYPFSNDKDWYLMSMDSRQGMMTEHIKIGKQYFDIKQLLLYSFGLQDQEFVVSYEVEDLVRFSELVNTLRSTDGRKFTLLDTPILTGVHQTIEAFVR
jgi:chlorite dismutase